jgi:hypothetical protein
MSRLLRPLVVAAFLALPAGAQDTAPATPDTDTEKGFSLIEEGARLLLRHMLDEVEPAVKDMQDGLTTAMREFGPVLKDIIAMAGDLHNYHAPEKLPNGDIILRRKAPLPPVVPDGPEIEL